MTSASPPHLASQLAAKLVHAHEAAEPVSPKPAEIVSTLDEAEAVQDAMIAALGEIGGWKLGATVPAVREALGLPRAFFGAVPMARMVHAEALAGPWKARVGIECEYAFRFGSDLIAGDTPPSTGDVIAAIASVHAAFEIPASRYASGLGGEGGLMLVADNGAAGWLLIGEGRPPAEVPELVGAPVRLTVNGSEVATGSAEVISGAPFEVVAEFVRLAHARGHNIRAGQFVATGSCTGYIQVPVGAEIGAEFPDIGKVLVRLDAA